MQRVPAEPHNVVRLSTPPRPRPESALRAEPSAVEAREPFHEDGSAARERGVEHASSHVRARGPSEPSERALERVGEYLRALGLGEGPRIQRLAHEICEAAERAAEARGQQSPALRGGAAHGAEESLPERAVALAQERVEAFWAAVFGDDASSVDPLWLRTFAAAQPELFLGDVGEAQRAAQRFGNPRSGQAPATVHFRDQKLEPLRFPRWLLGLMPAVGLTLGAGALLVLGLMDGGLTLLEGAWAALFGFLFGFAAIGLCTAIYGFAAGHGRRVEARGLTREQNAEAREPAAEPLPRSVLLMPVYHESAEDVFAALLAMRESLEKTPGGECFEIFVLSDSRDAEKAAEEERAFRRVAADVTSNIPVYYRRRARNERQKAGNLAEFFERWGHRYTYAVVLDADSLMRGETLVEMVRRIHASPRVALLQAPLELHRGSTLFARAQQLTASVSGPLFTRGLAVWAGGQANYYGHNAVLRVQAFLDCCALPELRGEPPLGGHILSHDFVEAALLCRAGWEVRIAHDLSGSWEELPPTLTAYVARDRRWCQGNLQHVRVALSEGLRPMSRLHMACGVASYVSSPLWLAFVGLGIWLAQSSRRAIVSPALAGALTLLTAGVLLGPRLLGAVSTWREHERRLAHGGTARLIASVLFETLLSGLLAPLMALHHTRIVASILSGRAVRWGAQKRRAGGELMSALRAELTTTLCGVGLAGWLLSSAPHLLWYLAPLWLPWTLAIPLSLAASSERAGKLAARFGLLAVPSEISPDELAERAEDLRVLTIADEAARFRDLVLDPVLVAVHVARLTAQGAEAGAREQAGEPTLARLQQRALRSGPAALSSDERRALMQDAESMRFLHRQAWRHWPVESWRLSRERPQVPPELG
jgi:membrane glycosyltransferase